MAIYHLTVKAYSRKDGHSSTAAAAYRAGVCIEDALTGEVHDYTKRHGVAFSALCLPNGQTEERSEFWNRVEAHHKRGDAVTCREVVVALPAELDGDARQDLARAFAKHLADTYGIAADLAIHEPSKDGDSRNHHAHILLSACAVSPDGTLGKKAEALDPIACKRAHRPTLADTQREHWAGMVNAALERAQVNARVDHRRLVDQKADALERGDFGAVAQLDRVPTKHEGKAVTQARRRGERTPRARRNDRVQRANTARQKAHEARFQRLKNAAQADGRLVPIDEQAAHARALLERTKEGRARLAQALPPKAAVPARAKRTAPHQAGASMPRRAAGAAGHRAKGVTPQLAPQIHTRVTGNGTKESEQVARVANAWLATLERDLAELLNKALTWGQRHADPLPRALARDYLHAEGEAQVATVLRDQAAADLKQARRDRHDARHYRDKGQAGLKGAGKLAERMGWTPKSLRDLQDAAKLSEEQVVMAKHSERFAIAAQEKTAQEAHRQRQRLLHAFQKAHPAEDFRFPEQWPLSAPEPAPELSPGKQPGAGASFLHPPLEPPRFRRPSGPR